MLSVSVGGKRQSLVYHFTAGDSGEQQVQAISAAITVLLMFKWLLCAPTSLIRLTPCCAAPIRPVSITRLPIMKVDKWLARMVHPHPVAVLFSVDFVIW